MSKFSFTDDAKYMIARTLWSKRAIYHVLANDPPHMVGKNLSFRQAICGANTWVWDDEAYTDAPDDEDHVDCKRCRKVLGL